MIYGPAPAPIARIRGRHRIRLLIKVKKNSNFQKALGSWANQMKLPGNVRLSIDIDPQTFFWFVVELFSYYLKKGWWLVYKLKGIRKTVF